MNTHLIERVENDVVELEYLQVTLRLLQGELWTIGIHLDHKPNDPRLLAFLDRVQGAIEATKGRIRGEDATGRADIV